MTNTSNTLNAVFTLPNNKLMNVNTYYELWVFHSCKPLERRTHNVLLWLVVGAFLGCQQKTWIFLLFTRPFFFAICRHRRPKKTKIILLKLILMCCYRN